VLFKEDMNNKKMGIEIKNEAKLEIAEIEIASKPFPSKTISWAGKTAIAVSSSGTPIKTDGIMSIKEWTMAFVKTITPSSSGVK